MGGTLVGWCTHISYHQSSNTICLCALHASIRLAQWHSLHLNSKFPGWRKFQEEEAEDDPQRWRWWKWRTTRTRREVSEKNGYHFGVDFGDRIYAHSTHSMLTLHFILHTLRSLKLTLHSLYTPLQLQNKVPMQHDKKTFKSMFPRESLDLQSWSWLIVCQGAWEHTFRNMFWSICQYVFFILVNNELKQLTSLPPQ